MEVKLELTLIQPANKPPFDLAVPLGRSRAAKEKQRRFRLLQDGTAVERYDYLNSHGWERISKEIVDQDHVKIFWKDPDATEPVLQKDALLRQVWRDMWKDKIVK